MQFRYKTLVVSAVLLMAGLALANEGPVSGEIQAFIVSTDSDGTEKIVSAEKTRPGQIMEFQIVFTNSGDDAVTGIQVVDPIPENTEFLRDSNNADVPAAFEVSIDGGASFEPEPVERIETQLDGTQKKVVVPPEEYTHIRWSARKDLESSGGQQRYTYRVSVN